MALRALLLRKKIKEQERLLEEKREEEKEIQTRSDELERSIEEIDETTSEEDKQEVDDAVEELEKDKEALETAKKVIEDKIKELKDELEKETEKEPSGKTEDPSKTEGRSKKGEIMYRNKFFGMSMEERSKFFEDENVRSFLGKVREAIKEKRELTNVGITIPDNMLPLIRQVTEDSSKLIGKVTLQRISGTGRQNIMGEIPESFWDEMCASLKEMSLAFNNVEVDGYKVSGYFAVCNAVLEDSDLDLAKELITAIGQALAKALDKAIIYGKGVKMPMGIVTSLLKTTAPDSYPDTGRDWVDLSKTNVKTGATSASGLKIFQEVIETSGLIDNDYNTDDITWMMNKKTHTKLLSESLGANANAAIVAGMDNQMPVIGGEIIEFKYIPDNTVIFGYMRNYLLVERAGQKLATSEHARFIEDQTVFKGTARYDGQPVIREAFAIYGIGGAPTTTTPLFAGETEPDDDAS